MGSRETGIGGVLHPGNRGCVGSVDLKRTENHERGEFLFAGNAKVRKRPGTPDSGGWGGWSY